MVLIAGSFIVPDGGMADLWPVMLDQVALTRREPGCIDYTCAADVLNPQRIVIHEEWQDQDSLNAHLGQPHVQAFIAALQTSGAQTEQLRAWDVDAVARPLGG